MEEISAEELAAKSRSALLIKTDNGVKAAEILRQAFPNLKVISDGDTVEIATAVEDSSALNKTLVDAGVKVYELKNESVSFEDYFIERLGK